MERPIGFVSKTLTAAEKIYSQLEKEGLAVVFGVKKFHKYLYGCKFVICTDHKPLLRLLSELKAVPQMASQRIMRWAVMLGAYEFVISYRAGKDNGNANAHSRLPVAQPSEEEPEEEHVLMLQSVAGSLTTAEQIKHWTSKDPVLSRNVSMCLKAGLITVILRNLYPINRDSKSSVFKTDVCCGEPVLLFQNRDVLVCWNSYINPTQVCPRQKDWQEATYGGRIWMLILKPE